MVLEYVGKKTDPGSNEVKTKLPILPKPPFQILPDWQEEQIEALRYHEPLPMSISSHSATYNAEREGANFGLETSQ